MFGREAVVAVTSLGVTNQRSSNKTQIGLKAVIVVVCFLFMNRHEQKVKSGQLIQAYYQEN